MDPKTVKQAARGHADAFAEVLRHISVELVRFFGVSLANPEAAPDAVGETFVRLARATSRSANATDPWVWAMPVARRVVADLAPPAGTAAPWTPESGTSWVKESILALPLQEREVFVTRSVLGWSTETTATRLVIRPEEVEMLLRTAREKMISGPVPGIGEESPVV